MIIKVKGYLTYRDLIGVQEIEQPNEPPISLLDFIQVLAEQVGGKHGAYIFDTGSGTVGTSVAIMLNGVHYNHLPHRLDTLLQDQDEVSVFPPGAGG